MPFNAIVEVSKQVPWHHVTCAYGSRLSTSLGHHPTRDQSLDGWPPIAAIVHQQLHGKARCHGLGRTNRRRYLRPPLRTTRNRGESMAICGRSSSFQTRMINLWKVIWIYLNLVRNRGRKHGYMWPFFILPNKDDQFMKGNLNISEFSEACAVLSYHVFSMNCQGFASTHSRFLPWKRIAQINQITTILTHSMPEWVLKTVGQWPSKISLRTMTSGLPSWKHMWNAWKWV